LKPQIVSLKGRILLAQNKTNMQVKELKKYLESFDQEAQVLVSSDEELNTMFSKFEVAVLGEDDNNRVVIYGLSGSEVEEDY